MKKMPKIMFIVALCASICVSIPVTNTLADVRITITFAAGGAACGGLYLFFFYSSDFTAKWHNTLFDSPALLNYSPEGWQVKPPVFQFIGDNNKNTIPYAEIIRVRF